MKVINLKKIIKMIFLLLIITIIIITCSKTSDEEISITTATNITNVTYKVLVDVEESKLYLFENGECVKTYSCSGGKWSTPSPIGTWTIVQKAKWGEGFRRKLASDLMFHGEILVFMEHLINIP